ncbi:HNH endonuclease family protein [Spirillospora sp. NBC_00431]
MAFVFREAPAAVAVRVPFSRSTKGSPPTGPPHRLQVSSSGSWYSPYDGITETLASEIDIDHIVPLAEAWRSGANTWTTSRRQAFANDLGYPS